MDRLRREEDPAACAEVLELASAGLDGELGPEQHEQLSRHLAACPACARQAAQLDALNAALQEGEGPSAEELAHCRARVLEAIDRTAATPAEPRPWWREWLDTLLSPSTALAFAAALFVLVSWPAGESTSPDPATLATTNGGQGPLLLASLPPAAASPSRFEADAGADALVMRLAPETPDQPPVLWVVTGAVE